MRRIALFVALLGLPSCVVPVLAPDLAKASVVHTGDEVWVDVPHLASARGVTALATGSGVEVPGAVMPGSTSIRFAGLAPGDWTLSLSWTAADARTVTITRSVRVEPYVRLTVLDPRLLGLEPAITSVPVLFAVPEWPAPEAASAPRVQRARVELTKAVRDCIECLIGPALELASEDALVALEDDRAASGRGSDAPGPTASTPLGARLLLVIDQRWPEADGLPCQLAVSAFAVGSRDDRLWNGRLLLFQDLVELTGHQLRADRNQSDVLVRALMPVLDALRHWPAVQDWLAGASPVLSPGGLDEFMFPAQAIATRKPTQREPTAPETPASSQAPVTSVPGSPAESAPPETGPLTGVNR